jgi:hypothetical protein
MFKNLSNSIEEESAKVPIQKSIKVLEPRKDTFPVTGKVFGAEDLLYVVDARFDCLLTSSRFGTYQQIKKLDFILYYEAIINLLRGNSTSCWHLLKKSEHTLISSQLFKTPFYLFNKKGRND